MEDSNVEMAVLICFFAPHLYYPVLFVLPVSLVTAESLYLLRLILSISIALFKVKPLCVEAFISIGPDFALILFAAQSEQLSRAHGNVPNVQQSERASSVSW